MLINFHLTAKLLKPLEKTFPVAVTITEKIPTKVINFNISPFLLHNRIPYSSNPSKAKREADPHIIAPK